MEAANIDAAGAAHVPLDALQGALVQKGNTSPAEQSCAYRREAAGREIPLGKLPFFCSFILVLHCMLCLKG